MNIHFQLQAEDFELFRAQMRQQPSANRRNWLAILSWLLISFFALAGVLILESEDFPGLWQIALFLTGCFIFSFAWLSVWQHSTQQQQWQAKFAGHYQLTLSPAGIARYRQGRAADFYPWSSILACQTTEQQLQLYLRHDVAILVPLRCFESESQQQLFLAQLQRWWQLAHPGMSLPTQVIKPPSIPVAALWQGFKQGLRAAFGLKIHLEQLQISRRVLAWQIALMLLLIALSDYFAAQPEPAFNHYGLMSFAILLLMMLAATVLISSATLRQRSLKILLLLMSSSYLACYGVLTVTSLTLAELEISHNYYPWLNASLGIWHILVVMRLIQQLFFQPTPAALWLASVYGGLVFFLSGLMPAIPFFYSMPPEDEPSMAAEDSKVPLDGEAIMYQQPALLADALQNLSPHRNNQTDLYFVGFAGEANENVFSNEVKLAQHQLSQRYQLADQSILLLNNKQTTEQIPLANRHNLRAVLKGIAQKMDIEQDVLFLFLSSHGAKDHHLSVSFWPMPLKSLAADELKQALDESGIRNRVIVISACYSGGFLDVLKDEHSLILTASRRDRVAYGCGDYTEFTYFGEAFFKDALPQHRNLSDAFYQARQMVEQRETQEEIEEHSEPQIHIGENIQAILATLQPNTQTAMHSTTTSAKTN